MTVKGIAVLVGSVLSLWAVCALFIYLQESQKRQSARKVAAVEEARITTSNKQLSDNVNVIGGAIVGGMIAGKVGMIAGAVAGQIESCSFVARADGKAMRFTFEHPGFDIIACSLLKQGDKVGLDWGDEWHGMRGEIVPD